MELFTERLHLRPFRKKDYTAVHSYASNAYNVKYASFGPNTPKETRHFISMTMQANMDIPQRNFDFVLETLDNQEVIGACGLYLRGEKEAELGFILHYDYWNKGYMTEAAKALIQFGFCELKLHRIFARCNSENIGSYRVMEKSNMIREACFRQVRKLRSEPDGRWYDEYQYSILDKDFFSSSETDL